MYKLIFLFIPLCFAMLTHNALSNINAESSERVNNYEAVKKHMGKSDSSYVIFDSLIRQSYNNLTRLHYYKLFTSDLLNSGENDSTINYALRALNLDFNNKEEYTYYGSILKIIISAYRKKSKYNDAFLYSQKYLKESFKYENKAYQVSAYILRASLFESVGDYASALDDTKSAQSIAESVHDEALLAQVYSNVSSLYSTMKDHRKSITSGQQPLKYFQENKKYIKVAQLANNMSLSYISLEEYDSADLMLSQALNASNKAYSKFGIIITKLNMAVNSYHKSDFVTALNLIAETKTFFKNGQDKYGEMLSDYNYCRIYLKIKDYGQSIKYGEWAYKNAKTNDFLFERPDIMTFLSESYEKTNKLEKALFYLKGYQVVKDSIDDEERNKEIGRLESRINLEKARYENQNLLREGELSEQKLAQSQLILKTEALVLIVVSMLLFLAYRLNRKLKFSKKLVQNKTDELIELHENQKRWFTNIAHELRTPLTLVSGPLNKVIEDETVNAMGKEDLQLASRNLRQLGNTVNEILDISKLENQQIELEMSATNFSNVVRSSVAAFESAAHVNKVLLKTNIESNVWLKIDENKIRKLIQNLLSNALKFTHEGGEIMTTLLTKDNEYVLTVSDTGEGINHEDLLYVFDRFYQSKDKNKSKQGGTGIGLALSKEIAQMHDGKLKVQSQKDEGSIFIFELPKSLKCEATESATAEKTETANINKNLYEPRLTEKPKVLIVEDNADMRIFIEGVMKKDYALTLARDGKDALEKLNKDHFDLIISDLMMPRMDGLTLIREVKQSKRWNEIPFIILTALNNEEERIHTLRTGIDDYLSKPFNPEELKVRSANLLANQQNRNTNGTKETESFDDKLLKTLEREVNDYLTDSILSVAYLADKVAMSERNLRRYLKKVTGLSPSDFILEIKLQKGLTFLESRTYPTVKEIAAYSGFERADRFSNAFTKRFGKKPGEYLS